MTAPPAIREAVPDELPGIEALHRAAFPQEDLLPLVRDLAREGPRVLSLVATMGDALAGHAMFTACAVAGAADGVALLGPLAVAPHRQRQGVGAALVRAGLGRLRQAGTSLVCVLGDPGYYARFGFRPERRILPPFALPPEWDGAWQSLTLNGADPAGAGTLQVPAPWRRRALWAP